MEKIQIEEGMCLKMQEIKANELKQGQFSNGEKVDSAKIPMHKTVQIKFACFPKSLSKKTKKQKCKSCPFFILFEIEYRDLQNCSL